MSRLLTILIFGLIAIGQALADDIVLRGTVSDAATGEALGFATIAAEHTRYATHADERGRWVLRVPAGSYHIRATFIGYDAEVKAVTASASSKSAVRFKLTPSASTIGEVVVTARESTGLSSASRIDRAAMEHLQPTSFTDLLELLPGNISTDPAMGSANTITLRETGGMTATGAKTDLSDDYAITSLGTSFVVDGAPVNSDANLQGVPTSDSTDPSGKRSTVNRGIDMRTISTDNIESVEIVRGIPSAEYGNLTSGLVNIKRIRRSTPINARFKADQYSKLFSVGKGFALPGSAHILNVDAGYLDSKVDPRDNLENYKRVTGSLRATFNFTSPSVNTLWNVGTDYTGSFDNAKVDPDLNYNKIDIYKSSYNRMALTTDLTFTLLRCKWLKTLGLNASMSYERDRLERTRQVAPQRASVAPTSMEEGVHDGQYLLQEYIADFVSDGRPLNLFAKLKAAGSWSFGTWLHDYKGGIEWQMAKNYGHGQIYDLTRPLSASWTTRPRDFSEIPALHTLSAYVEDNITALLGDHKLELQAGVRSVQMPSLSSRYYLANRVYLDPRINAVWNFPSVELASRPMQLFVAGGYGLTTKLPTIDYLYPQVHYNDLVQLNYYDVNDPYRLSRISLRTYIADATNYELRAARNHKWEIRAGFDWGGNRLSVTYFQEKMTSGFRYSSIYTPYAYRSYDASAINPDGLTAPPDINSLPYTDLTVLDGFRKVTNGSRIDKQGVEFQFNSVRWPLLRTSLIVNGAWFRSTYSNSQMLYSTVNDVVGNQPVSDLYVGLYNTDDGRINEQFNTNFTFDTQIPRWGLVFTTSVQCMWWMKTTRLRQNGIPDFYMATDGQLHPFTEADHTDVMLQYLVKTYNEQAFATQTVPTAVYLNFKATKKIGRWLRISAFVNRIIDYLPDYKSNGLTIRRTADAYFGMEATFTL